MKKEKKKIQPSGKKRTRSPVESLLERAKKYAEESAFMDEVSEMSDSEIKDSFKVAFPKSAKKGFVSDSAVPQPE